MGKISTFIGKMPFAGKSAVENAAMSAICERNSVPEKKQKVRNSFLFLGVFAALHGLQARLGVLELMTDIPDVAHNPTAGNIARTAISSVYTLANSAVAYTQAEIALRVVGNYRDFTENVDAGVPLAELDYSFERRIPTSAQVLTTIAGQAIFLAQMHH